MYLQEENPCSLGEKKPYKLPQLDKKPQFTISVYSSGPVGLQLYPIPPFLDYLNSLKTTISFSSLFKTGVYYIPARPCWSITVYLLFLLYLNYPLYAISYWLLLYTLCLPPLRAIEGVKGIYLSINYHYRQAGYIYLGIFYT